MKKTYPHFLVAFFFILFFNRVFAQGPPVIFYPNNPTTPTYVYTAGTAISPLNINNTGGAVTANSLTTFSTDPGGGQPYGIAYDPTTGDIITDNFGAGAVYRYSPSGVLLNTYTTSIATGGPKDIVVDNSGNIFVANGTGANIVKITPSGTTTTISATGTPFSQPDGMSIDRNTGTIYIADQGTNAVYTIASGATTATVYKNGFTNLYGVTVNASTGVVYVSEYTPQADIKQIAPGTKTVTTFISKAAGGFTDLRNLDIDASGNIFVANYGNNSIDEFSSTGTFLGHIVTGLNQPRATAEDVFGNLYIANSGGGNVKEYSTAFYSINIPLPAGMSFDTTTGQIIGTPIVTSPTTVYTVVGHNANGSGYTTVTITVNPTAPTGTGDFICGAGVVTLTASGGYPAGGTYSWYAASTGGTALATGATYSPSISATTTYYLDYTQGGVTCAARVPVVATVGASPVISVAPTTSGAYYLSYGFTAGSVSDISGSNNGTLRNAPTTTNDRYGVAGNAYNFVSSSSQYISTATSSVSPGPQTFSISAWFKTTTAGGYITGFGSSATGSSTNVDRVIYIGTDGKLYFGVQPVATKKTINTIAAYNDGNWHHVVATFSTTNGSNMYVDGALAASDPTMNSVHTTAGNWRIAFDALTGYTNAPATFYFNGALDDIAVANTEISTSQINVLYGAGASTFCPGNALSLTSNTVAGATYSWVGPAGSGFTSTSQNPTVAAANAIAGIYELTVTSASGCTSVIDVTAPSNVITYTWSGAAGTTNPTTAGNWNKLPLFNSTTNLVIPTGLSKYPVLTANQTVYGLTIANGASLSLGGFTLSVGCNIINNATTGGTTGILYGSNNASGVTWNGSFAAQSYTGTNNLNTAQLGDMTVNNSVGGTVTIKSGPLDIYDMLTMTKGNLTVSSSPAALTLKSSVTQTASVAIVPPACTISGNVNVERYVQGSADLTKRGYRLISSAVYTGVDAASANAHVFDVSYLLKSVYVSGPGTGFNVTTTTNPSLYLFREDNKPPASNSVYFRTEYNWKGIDQINNSPVYNIGTQSKANKSNVPDTTTTIPVGNGILFYFRGDLTASLTSPFTAPVSTTLTQTGTLNTGTINVRLWYANSAQGNKFSFTPGWVSTASLTGGYTFVGNPYASTINWEKYNRNGTSSTIYGTVSTVIWVFNEASKQYQSYIRRTATIASAADTTTTVYLGTGSASNMIASGQGFFVQATAAGQTLSFREAAKTSTQPTAVNLHDLMGKPKEFTADPEVTLRLKLITDSINNDDILIGINKQSSTKFVVNEDAQDIGGSGNLESLSAFSADSIPLAIDNVPFPGKQREIIPLFTGAASSGNYTLACTQLDKLPILYQVWLKDAFTNDSLKLKTNATYQFAIDKNNPATFGNNRFSVIIGQDTANAYRLLDFTANKVITARQVQLVWKTKYEQNYTYFTVERSTDSGKTFDVIGGLQGTDAGTYSLLDKKPITGLNLYRLKQVDINDSVTYSKVIPIQYIDSENAADKVRVYPNPALNIINVAIADNVAVKPPYTIQITSSSGVLVKQVNLAQTDWQSSVSGLKPGTYIIKVRNSTDNSFVGDTKFVKL